MVKCTICGKYCKNLAGLSGHIQFKHPEYKLQPKADLKNQKINQQTCISHQRSYQYPQDIYPPYQVRMQNIPADNNLQYNPYIQRNQGIPPYYPTFNQELEEYIKLRKLLYELKHYNKDVPEAEIEGLKREIKTLRSQIEKTTLIKERPVKVTIADIEPLDRIKTEKDNIQDPLCSFSSPTDNKYLEEKEKTFKALESYHKTKLELERYEREAEYGNPIFDAFLISGLNIIQQIAEAIGNKPKKYPPPKRVTLIPSPKWVTLKPVEEKE